MAGGIDQEFDVVSFAILHLERKHFVKLKPQCTERATRIHRNVGFFARLNDHLDL
jgi:hypothetical protein